VKQESSSAVLAEQRRSGVLSRRGLLGGSVLALVLAARWAAGDQVEMKNGDRYAGKVLTLSSNTIVLQSEVLGTLTLPRAKVASVTVGVSPATNLAPSVATLQASALPVVRTNTPLEGAGPLGRLGADTNLIQQVQTQFLNGAGPEAKAKFDELLGGLMSGKVSMNDIREQAKAAADQLRSLKQEQGNDPSGMLDSYLAILEKFIKDTAPSSSTATNSVGR